ncbi:MAG: M23 family metallopeptidase, partial [Actinomycetes bacterium]
DGDGDLFERYQAARRQLDRWSARLSDQVDERESESARLTSMLTEAFRRVGSASEELAAYAAGSELFVEGFVFPVAGPVEFVDTWGAPRMSGTSYAHWHQGTDIFAPFGAPLVAAENGVVNRIGFGTLGGNKLWVVGESGTAYYYAHLSAFAPGLSNGTLVRAGQVVGYVGNTGNAVGTPFHCHFEVHPNDAGPINPYPLLKATYTAPAATSPVFGAPTVPGSPFASPVPAASPATNGGRG